MLTVNATDHPLMRLFHKPGDERRTVVILSVERYDDWLRGRPEQAQARMRQFPAEQMTADEPTAGRGLF